MISPSRRIAADRVITQQRNSRALVQSARNSDASARPLPRPSDFIRSISASVDGISDAAPARRVQRFFIARLGCNQRQQYGERSELR